MLVCHFIGFFMALIQFVIFGVIAIAGALDPSELVGVPTTAYSLEGPQLGPSCLSSLPKQVKGTAVWKKRLTGADLDTARCWHVAGTDLGRYTLG
jgi:hypothetical protein